MRWELVGWPNLTRTLFVITILIDWVVIIINIIMGCDVFGAAARNHTPGRKYDQFDLIGLSKGQTSEG